MLPYYSFFSWKLGPITIQSYGLLVALGFFIAISLIQKKFRSKKNKAHANNIGIIAIVGGITGARIAYVLNHLGEFSLGNLLDIINVFSGGLSWIGGFIFAVFCIYLYIRKNKLDFWKYADKIAAPLALGHAFGRIGCILGDGGHVGKITTVPWCFNVEGVCRHVSAYYSAIMLFGMYFILKKIESKKIYKGFVFQLYLVLYGIGRFFIDTIRIDPRYFGLTTAQWACLAMIITGSVLIYKGIKRRKTEDS